jgi:hypothetical protein
VLHTRAHLQNEENKVTVAPPATTAAAAAFCREATAVPHPRGFCGFPHPNRPRVPTVFLLRLLRQTATACAPPAAWCAGPPPPTPPAVSLPATSPEAAPTPAPASPPSVPAPLPRLPRSGAGARRARGARRNRQRSTRRPSVEHVEAVGGARGGCGRTTRLVSTTTTNVQIRGGEIQADDGALLTRRPIQAAGGGFPALPPPSTAPDRLPT